MTHKKISIRHKGSEEEYDTIDFPKSEHKSLKKRLDDGKSIYSTRIKDEKNEYSLKEFLNSPFGLLKVIEVKTFKSGENHPFEKNLTNKQREKLKGKAFDLIKLVSVP